MDSVNVDSEHQRTEAPVLRTGCVHKLQKQKWRLKPKWGKHSEQTVNNVTIIAEAWRRSDEISLTPARQLCYRCDGWLICPWGEMLKDAELSLAPCSCLYGGSAPPSSPAGRKLAWSILFFSVAVCEPGEPKWQMSPLKMSSQNQSFHVNNPFFVLVGKPA